MTKARRSVTPDDLGDVLKDQPSVDQMWQSFIERRRGEIRPELVDGMESLFKAGACFAIFSLLEAIDLPEFTADDLEAYTERLEVECRSWVAHMAALVAAKERLH